MNINGTSLARTAGSGAMLRFTSGTGQLGRGTASATGQSPQITFTTAPTLTNGIIGGWAIHGGTDFLTYLSTPSSTGALGLGVLGDTGSGFAAYNTNDTDAGDLPASASTANVRMSGNANTNVPGARSFNSLAWAASANNNNVTYAAAGDTLTITSGGLIHSGDFTGAIGQGVDVGRLTQGSGELFLYNNQNTLTINSRITGTNKVVLSGGGSSTIALTNGPSVREFTAAVTGTNAQVASSTGMFVGQTVTGPSGYTGTITAIVDGTNVTLSGAPTAGNGFYRFGGTGSIAAVTGGTNTSGNAAVTFATAQPGLFVGQPVFGTGVPLGATISAISADGLTVTLSAVTTAAITGFTPGTVGNSYTGGTIVNNGVTLQLNPARPGEVVVPSAGGLTINGGAVTMGTTSIYGAIASGTNVTINSGSLTYPNYVALSPAMPITNTLGAISFSNVGSIAAPTLALGAPAAGQIHKLVVTGITSVNDNLATVPTISGTFTDATRHAALEFSGATPTLNVSGNAPAGLVISAAITQNAAMTGALVKTGNSGVVLSSGSSNWTTGLTYSGANAGSVILGAASTPSTVGATVTSGPLGTGTLTVGATATNATLLTDGTARTIANPVVLAGNLAFGGTVSGHNVTLNGTMDLGSAQRSLHVVSPQVTATIGGVVSGTGGGINKTGEGILVLGSTVSPTLIPAPPPSVAVCSALPPAPPMPSPTPPRSPCFATACSTSTV